MGLIPDDIIAQVLDRSDIAATIGGYVALKRAGRNFKANCPFHNEKTPSFVVNPDKQIFHCFGCGAGGNVVGFIMRQEHLTFPEAVRFLADRAGIEIKEDNTSSQTSSLARRQEIVKVNELALKFFHQMLVTGKEPDVKKARTYLKSRDVDLPAVKSFQIGFAPDSWDGLIEFCRLQNCSVRQLEKAGLVVPREKSEGFYDRFRNRITFPIFDVNGQCVGFGARAMDDHPAKYINSPETAVYTKGRHLYGLHLAKQAIIKEDAVIVVEGYLDQIMPFQQGVKNIVASLGTALTVEQIRLLRRYTHNVIMLFDTDPAGEAAMLRSLDLLIEEGMQVKVVTLDEGADPDSFVRARGVEAFCARLNKALTVFDYKFNRLSTQFDAQTIEGRAKISQAMSDTIARFDNAVVQEGYLKKLADALSVSRESLLQEFHKIKPAVKSAPVKSQSSSPEAFPNVELNILALLAEHPEWVQKANELVQPEDFVHAETRAVFEEIQHKWTSGDSISIAGLLTVLEQNPAMRQMAQVAIIAQQSQSEGKRMLEDCLVRLKKESAKKERQRLTLAMKEAERLGNLESLEALKLKFNQLMKR